MIKNLSIGFAAGSLGALANVVFVLLAGISGLIAAMDLQLPPPEQPAFLYKQMVWGGVFGLLLAAPWLEQSWILRGLILGLLASLVALFVFFPRATVGGQGPGMAGLNLGMWMPVLVLLANWVWGLVAAKWYDLAHGDQASVATLAE